MVGGWTALKARHASRSTSVSCRSSCASVVSSSSAADMTGGFFLCVFVFF
jgi:hypothetical protein